jgi:hypothetical protein
MHAWRRQISISSLISLTATGGDITLTTAAQLSKRIVRSIVVDDGRRLLLAATTTPASTRGGLVSPPAERHHQQLGGVVDAVPRGGPGGAAGRELRAGQPLSLRVVDARHLLLRLVRRGLRQRHGPRRRPHRLRRRQPDGRHPGRHRQSDQPPHAGPAPPPGHLRRHPGLARAARQPHPAHHLLHRRLRPGAVVPVAANGAHPPRPLLQLPRRPHPGDARRPPRPLQHRPQPQPPLGPRPAAAPQQVRRRPGGVPRAVAQQPLRQHPRRVRLRQLRVPGPVAQRLRRRRVGRVRQGEATAAPGPLPQRLRLQPHGRGPAGAAGVPGPEPQRHPRPHPGAGGRPRRAAAVQRQLQQDVRRGAHGREHGQVRRLQLPAQQVPLRHAAAGMRPPLLLIDRSIHLSIMKVSCLFLCTFQQGKVQFQAR